ncbi:hypothetical protein pb186bvf_018649 [Paramecium bursaria]
MSFKNYFLISFRNIAIPKIYDSVIIKKFLFKSFHNYSNDQGGSNYNNYNYKLLKKPLMLCKDKYNQLRWGNYANIQIFILYNLFSLQIMRCNNTVFLGYNNTQHLFCQQNLITMKQKYTELFYFFNQTPTNIRVLINY